MTSSSGRPAIVFVPGLASVGTVVFEPTVAQLKALGWAEQDLITVNNPSVDHVNTKASIKPHALAADIRNLRTVLSELIDDQGRDVLLVAHSYGSAPALSAAQDLWRHVRQQQGKAGGVIKVGLIAAALPLPGRSVADDRVEWLAASNMPPDPWSEPEVIDGEPILTPTGFENYWMNDIDDKRYRSSLRQAALTCLLKPVEENIDPKQWRVNYLVLQELDLVMPEAFQRHLIDGGKKAGAQIETAELKAGHFAQISRPKEVAEWVVGLIN